MPTAYGDWSPYERSYDRIGLIGEIGSRSLLKPLIASLKKLNLSVILNIDDIIRPGFIGLKDDTCHLVV